MLLRSTSELERLYRHVRKSPFNLCSLLNFEPTWQQAEVLTAVHQQTFWPPEYRKKRIAVKSGQGPGKTTVSVIAGVWRALLGPKALTVVSAPTMRQCKDVWLTEARRLFEKAHPALRRHVEITRSKVVIAGDPDWGVWTVTATRAENAQGYHQKYLTFIFDEASGVEDEIIQQAKGTLTNKDSLLLMIGNPNQRNCTFYKCFTSQRSMWDCYTFNAEESPLVSKENIHLLEREYGRDSDVFRVRVLGEFPYRDPDVIISEEDVIACTKTDPYKLGIRSRTDLSGKTRPAKQFGIDFARFGGDESVIYRRQGNVITEKMFFNHTEPSQVVLHAFDMQRRAGWSTNDTWFVPDAGGMGQGVLDMFYNKGKNVLEFHTNGTACSSQYSGKMTEAYFNLRHLFANRLIHIEEDDRLIEQLCTRKYFADRKDGKIEIEPKKLYCKEHESPDRAEGLAMAFYDSTFEVGQPAIGMKSNRINRFSTAE